MNQKTVRQLKRFGRENKIDFHVLKARWESTPWNQRHAFRAEVTEKVVPVKTAKQKQTASKAKTTKIKKAG